MGVVVEVWVAWVRWVVMGECMGRSHTTRPCLWMMGWHLSFCPLLVLSSVLLRRRSTKHQLGPVWKKERGRHGGLVLFFE